MRSAGLGVAVMPAGERNDLSRYPYPPRLLIGYDGSECARAAVAAAGALFAGADATSSTCTRSRRRPSPARWRGSRCPAT